MGWNEERVAVFSLLPPEVVVFGLVDTEGNECDFFRFTETLFCTSCQRSTTPGDALYTITSHNGRKSK
jgi:hypothetical protein